jgi:hypothetical protein
MNQKTLIGLVVAALIAIGFAIAINHSNQPRSESGGETPASYLVPGLREHVNDVDKLVLTGAENKPVATLTRGADGWTIAEKGGFAADTGKLREFLLKLADAKLVEQKTANKDKYATLGVEDVSDKDAKGIQVELGGLAQPVKLIVGTANARGGTFVRRGGDAQSWLASGSLNVDKKAENWLRKDLIDVAANRVESVSITRDDGKSVRISKASEGDANFKLADVPKGREAGSEFTVNGVAATLAGLKFDDVVAAKDASPAEKPLKAHYATFDGLVVDITAWEKDGKDYARFIASVDPEQAGKHIAVQQAKAKSDYDAEVSKQQNTATPATAAPKDGDTSQSADANANTANAAPAKPPEVADPAKDREQKLADLDKQVSDMNARFKDWTYILPPYKYASINKSMDDLLKPLDEKKSDNSKKPDASKKPETGKKAKTPPAKTG